MRQESDTLKLGKGSAFVKSRLKRLRQEDETWEADFRALPKPIMQSETHYIGMVVSQPDGDMGAYMRSLEKLHKRDEKTYWPTHGTAIEDPKSHVAGLIAHRRHREDQIADCLRDGRGTIPEMVEAMYVGLDPRLIGGARRSVQSHLIHMIETGRAACTGAPELDAVYSLPR